MPVDIALNHAMIYSRDVAKSLAFYSQVLGFEILEQQCAGPHLVYARLRVSGTDSTVALHAVEPGQSLHTGGVRLYFEIRALEKFCKSLAKDGVVFTKPPEMMPWGWKHAYLTDPDGHEISLYWAGAKRLKKVKCLQ